MSHYKRLLPGVQNRNKGHFRINIQFSSCVIGHPNHSSANATKEMDSTCKNVSIYTLHGTGQSRTFILHCKVADYSLNSFGSIQVRHAEVIE